MTASPSTRATGRPTRPDAGHVPGEPGIWVLIGGDLVLFSLLFFLYLSYRAHDVALFTQSQHHLDQNLGLVNTIVMLTSSWLVATGIRAARRDRGPLAGRLFTGALACAGVFVVVKYVEYRAKLAAGLTPTTNDFFMYYFCLTGIHLIHVVIGSGVLTVMARSVRRGPVSAAKLRNLESAAIFWHLVDLLWIVLFALLYLVGTT